MRIVELVPCLIVTLVLGCATKTSSSDDVDEPIAEEAKIEEPMPAVEEPSVEEQHVEPESVEEIPKELDEVVDDDTDPSVPGGVPSDDVASRAAYLLANRKQDLPFKVVMSHALYDLDPDDDDMLAARTANSPNPFEVVIAFCVNLWGKAIDIQVVGDDPDPALTQVVLESMDQWRFKPFKKDGSLIKTCTERRYRFKFG